MRFQFSLRYSNLPCCVRELDITTNVPAADQLSRYGSPILSTREKGSLVELTRQPTRQMRFVGRGKILGSRQINSAFATAHFFSLSNKTRLVRAISGQSHQIGFRRRSITKTKFYRTNICTWMILSFNNLRRSMPRASR